jgi:hypothetical protein
MKFKVLIGAIIAAAALALPVANAAAAPAASQGAWYWSAKAAAKDLVADGLDDASAHYPVTYAECAGYGKRWKGLYRHFTCYVEASGYVPFYISFHVKGKQHGSWEYLYDA